MSKTFLIASIASGLIGLIVPAFAQNTGTSTVVTTDRVVVTQDVVASSRAAVPVQVPASIVNAHVNRPIYAGGGAGGAIGGYYINGTTRADNRALPGGVWPYR